MKEKTKQVRLLDEFIASIKKADIPAIEIYGALEGAKVIVLAMTLREAADQERFIKSMRQTIGAG